MTGRMNFLILAVMVSGATAFTKNLRSCPGYNFDECGICHGPGIPADECDCDGSKIDCDGRCGGLTLIDECGVCGGPGLTNTNFCDCDGTEYDECNVCGGDATPGAVFPNAGHKDCSGVCHGNKTIDECGVCDGGNANMDCNGNCNGLALRDFCGVCLQPESENWNGTKDCNGECGGLALIDDCKVCQTGGKDGNSEWNALKDCSGECNGDYEEDGCGDCGPPLYGRMEPARDRCGVCDGKDDTCIGDWETHRRTNCKKSCDLTSNDADVDGTFDHALDHDHLFPTSSVNGVYCTNTICDEATRPEPEKCPPTADCPNECKPIPSKKKAANFKDCYEMAEDGVTLLKDSDEWFPGRNFCDMDVACGSKDVEVDVTKTPEIGDETLETYLGFDYIYIDSLSCIEHGYLSMNEAQCFVMMEHHPGASDVTYSSAKPEPADKIMVPTVYEETDMCKDGKAGGVGGKGFPCPDACYFQAGQSTNGRYTFGTDVHKDRGITRKSVCNRENVCICLVETCQNNPTGHMIDHMSQCTATRVGEECTPTCYGPATGDYVNYRGAHAMGNFVNHEPTGPATCESIDGNKDTWSGVYCVCADVSDADFSELMVTAGLKPEPTPGTPPAPPSYIMVETGQCQYPVTTEAQCSEGGAAVFNEALPKDKQFTSFGNKRTQTESGKTYEWKAPHCAMSYDGGVGVYYLNFDPAGGNTGECSTQYPCVCLEQPSIPSSCTEAAPLCAAEEEATKKMMTDYCPVTCESCPTRPPRVTTKGCACEKEWTLTGTDDGGNSYPFITDYCANPDKSEGGDWCFLTPDGELCEGTDPNYTGHGYCEEEAK